MVGVTSLNSQGLESLFESKTQVSIKNRIKLSLFTVFYQIFHRDLDGISASFLYKFRVILEKVLVSLQAISLLWKFGVPIKAWVDYEIFWICLSYARLDLLCATLDFIQGALLLTGCINFAVFFSIICCHFMVAFSKPPFSVLKSLANQGVHLVSTIFFVPFLKILMVSISNSFSSNEEISEYKVKNGSFNNTGGLIRDVFSLVVLLLLNGIYEYFAVEVRHTEKNRIVTAKAQMKTDLQAKFFYAVLVALNTFIYDSHILLFQVVFCLGSMYIALHYLYFQPYYLGLINQVNVFAFSLNSIASFSFLLGYINDDAKTILVLFIFISPVVCLLMNWLNSYRISLIPNVKFENCTPDALELKHRYDLSNESDSKKEILTEFDKKFIISKKINCQLFGVWQVYYCLNVLGDIRLAFVKFSKCFKCSYSLFADFQMFKCAFLLNSIDLHKYEDLCYIRYALKFDKATKKDLELCISLLQFWGNIISKSDLQTLNKLAEEIGPGLIYLQKEYEELVTNYSATDACKQNLKSFLEEIVLGGQSLERLEGRLSSNKLFMNDQKITYFDDKNGVILVSGNEENIGEIVYCNNKFAEALNQKANTVVGNNISIFIPGLYSSRHDDKLQNFVNFTLNTKVNVSGTLFIQTEQGFIVEGTVKIRCSAIENNVFFLVILQGLSSQRHIIIPDEEGVIYSYSQKLPELLKIPNLKMMNLNTIFHFSAESFATNVPYYENYNGKDIWIIKEFRKVGRKQMDIFLIYESEGEMKKLNTELQSNYKLEKPIENFSVRAVRRASHQNDFMEQSLKNEQAEKDLVKSLNNQHQEEKIVDENTETKQLKPRNSLEYSNDQISEKILAQALRGIKLYKWVLLGFVRNT